MGYVAINKLSLLDYPGKICCILFTNKCNLYCPFCHNGLTLLPSEDLLTFEDVKKFLNSRKGKIDAVTITGGEPTLLPHLKEDIREIKKLGYSVKLDTNGTCPNVVRDLLNEKLVDYVAMDVKNSIEMYPETTGTPRINLENIKETIHLLNHSGVDHEFRTTLVAEFHTLDSIRKMGELLKGSPKLFLQQYKMTDGVINKSLHPVDEGLTNEFKSVLEQYVQKVELRGY